ncbi:MAG TPA: hypothetical protein PKA28_11305 [Methylomusa anaerophila]|uniref:hypothetical protein n=1 Tax=Methylomusa anaerophila TaxID=1930071 RepID=UPI000F81A820|nr:hypothetical protein [Methylomusa anaerophila]HML89021.1 hypothetical protein [Methylomusa anaerophila]
MIIYQKISIIIILLLLLSVVTAFAAPAGIKTPPTPANNPKTLPAPEALIEFRVDRAGFDGNIAYAEGVFYNSGEVKIKRIKSITVKLWGRNSNQEDMLVAVETFRDIPVNLSPGEFLPQGLFFRKIYERRHYPRWWSEETDWEFELERSL